MVEARAAWTKRLSLEAVAAVPPPEVEQVFDQTGRPTTTTTEPTRRPDSDDGHS
jgi:hypothetical protein